MSPSVDSVPVWVLTDRLVGSANQSIAVAEALGLPFETKQIVYEGQSPWKRMIGKRAKPISLDGVDVVHSSPLHGPWPRAVISAGSRLARVNAWIRAESRADNQAKGRTLGARSSLAVHIQDPGAQLAGHLDLWVPSRHDVIDPKRTPPQLVITGAPHRLTAAVLDASAQSVSGVLSGLPRPWIFVAVGGDHGGMVSRRAFTSAMAQELGLALGAAARSLGGRLLVTTSVRTKPAAVKALRAALPETARVYAWGDAGANPYQGWLASADYLVVTGDSISMLTEATATGRPLYIYAPDSFTRALHRRFHEDLYDQGIARPFRPGGAFESWSYDPVNPAQEIADWVRARLDLPMTTQIS